MPGRPVKPRQSINREAVLGRLNDDVVRFRSAQSREAMEHKTGQRQPNPVSTR
jgi:hypothetical protein